MSPAENDNETSMDEAIESLFSIANVSEIEESEFDREVLQRSRTIPVIVCFGAPWSAPSRAVLQALAVLALEARTEARFVHVDIDHAAHVSRSLSVLAIPDVRGYADGVQVVHVIGHLHETLIRRALDPVLRSPATLHALQGLHASAAGNCGEAEAEYRLALQFDPGHPAALLGLGRLLEERADVEGATALYRRVSQEAPQHRIAQARLQHLTRGDREPATAAAQC